MKKLLLMGSKKGWMVLTVMLIVFITIASILLLIVRPLKEEKNVTETVIYYENNVNDHSYEAVKDRVDSMNENYGSQVKAIYSGEESTAEKLMKQRMVHTTIKNLLMYVLIILVILLILVKGFNLKLFKKKTVKETPKTVSESPPEKKKVNPTPKTPESKSVPKENTDGENDAEPLETENEEIPSDEAQVISDCKLP